MTPERNRRLSAVLHHRQPDLTVVMENVFDPHNISAVMRTCDAVGIQDVYILNNRIPPHRKWGHRSSSTAANWLTIHQFTDADAGFAEGKKKYSKIYTTYLSEGSPDLFELDLTQSVALVFGNETFGVSKDILRFSDGNFQIPQAGMIRSLNISVACAVTLYEAYRQKVHKGHYSESRLEPDKLRQLSQKWGLE
jgi:tRNA (guanosine-2'-O-)-methyltransferase